MWGDRPFLVNLFGAQLGEFIIWGEYPECVAGGAEDGLRLLAHLIPPQL